MCMYRAENKALLQSIQNSYPRQLGDDVNRMSDEEGRVEWDLGVVFLCILKPPCREAQWAAEYPLSQGKSQRHVRSPSDACVERTHGDESIEEQCSDSEWLRCFAWFLMPLPSLVKQGNESWWPESDQKGPYSGCWNPFCHFLLSDSHLMLYSRRLSWFSPSLSPVWLGCHRAFLSHAPAS